MHSSETPSEQPGAIYWPKLFRGTLIKRYKRFLADVTLDSGETVTAHCANSGSMKECSEPGRPVWLSYHDNPKRKLKYSWEMIDMGTSLVGTNTGIPNRLIKLSAENNLIPELTGYETIKAEVKAGKQSRLDLALYSSDRRTCYVEIKNSTLVDGNLAMFPDAVTSRGLKHLHELKHLVSEGNRCMMVYLVQRMDAFLFRPADHIDPAYGEALRDVVKAGVEIAVYDVDLTPDYIKLRNPLPYEL